MADEKKQKTEAEPAGKKAAESAQEAKPVKKRGKKKEEPKVEKKKYVISLGSVYSAPRQKRARRAIVAVKRFMAKHLRAEPEDVLISNSLNEFIWSKGREHIPRKVNVKVIIAEGKVNVYLGDEKIEKKEKPREKEEETKEDKAVEAEKKDKALTEEEKEFKEDIERKKREKKIKEMAAEKGAMKKGIKG